MNHLGKLAFQWFYWHLLLPGHDIPGLTADMPRAGKRLPAPTDSSATAEFQAKKDDLLAQI